MFRRDRNAIRYYNNCFIEVFFQTFILVLSSLRSEQQRCGIRWSPFGERSILSASRRIFSKPCQSMSTTKILTRKFIKIVQLNFNKVPVNEAVELFGHCRWGQARVGKLFQPVNSILEISYLRAGLRVRFQNWLCARSHWTWLDFFLSGVWL